jgi:hypothetical protein
MPSWRVLVPAGLGAAGIAIGVAVAAGGSDPSGPSPNGPLGHTAQRGVATECVTLRTAVQPATLGIATLHVPPGHRGVVLDSIYLVRSHHVRLVGALVVRHRSGGIGAMAGFPPTSADVAGIRGYDWRGRQPLVNARLAPTPAGVEYDVLLGVALTGPRATRGSFAWSLLSYHEGARRFTLATVAGGKLSVRRPWC